MSKLRTNEISPFSSPGIGIGAPNTQPGCLLNIQSTVQGFAMPRMSTAQRNNIPSPFNGLMIYNLDTSNVERFNGVSWVSAEGVKSINGLSDSNQLLITGSAGTSPNWTQSGLDTHVLNIPQASIAGVSSGLISNADYTSFNGRQYPAKNVLYVTKNSLLGPQDFNSIKDALDNITDNSSTNPYLVLVFPGIYVEDILLLKSFVTLASAGHSTVTIQPSNPNNDIIQVNGSNCRFQGCTLQGATGANAAAIRIISAVSPCILDFITISDCTEEIVVTATTSETQVVLRNVRLISGSTTRKLLKIQASGFNAIVRVYSAIFTDDIGAVFEDAIFLTGPGSRIDANSMLVRSTVGVGYGLRAEDGAEVVSQVGSEFEGFDINFATENVGSAPLIRTDTIMLRSGNTYNLKIDHPGTTGSLSANLDTSINITIDDSAPIKFVLIDPMPGNLTGMFIKGDILQADIFSKKANLSKFLRNSGTVGLLSGGTLSAGANPFDVDVAAGTGFTKDGSGILQEVSWSATTLSFSANEDFYITVNSNGVIQTETLLSDLNDRIVLGRIASDLDAVEIIEKSSMFMTHHGNRVEDYLRALGPIYDFGSIVTEFGTRNLSVSAGRYKFGTTTFTPTGGSSIPWEAYYSDGSGGFNEISGQTTIDNTQWDDGSGVLQPLSSGFYAKHTLYVVGDAAEEKYFLVYSQDEYSTLVQAEGAALPNAPSFLRDGATIIAAIIVQEGQANIVQIQDARPQIGFKATGVSASAVHGNLLGLFADDHPQYLLTSGVRSMSGNLDLGANDIINVGLVDGVDVSAHASRHLPNGADAITTAAPLIALSATTTNSVGTANSLSRSDHNHSILTGIAVQLVPDQANTTGTASELARRDHIHNVPTAAPSGSIGANSTNAQGIAASFARSDHGHQLSIGTPVTLLPDQSNSSGTSNNLPRADHVHSIPTAVPVNTGTQNLLGSAASFARSDHVHNTVIVNTEISSSTPFATGSGVDVVITGFSITPSAGTYLVWVNFDATHSNNNGLGIISIYSNGVQVANSERTQHYSPGNISRMFSMQAKVSVNGSQAIDARVRTNTGTFTVNNRSLIVMRVGP